MSNQSRRDAAFRVLDANLNRASEGLRTLEEIARFVLDDGSLSSSLKQLRHRLQSAMSAIPAVQLFEARDTSGDVGTETKTQTELLRDDMQSIAAAASQRLQQSLRVLEEFAKLVNVDASRQIEGIRYTAYDVLASLQLKLVPHRSIMESAKLYLLIDCSLDETSFAEQVDELARAGVDIFQIRDKNCDDRKVMRYLRLAKEISSKRSAKVIINDRADLAILCEADGVHVGQEDMPCREVKRLLGSNFIVGVSTHNVQQIRQAVEDGADYIGCGPTFPTTTKSFDQYAGLSFLREAAEQSSIPAFAIGGIQLDNLPQVLETGMQRVAVSSGILKTSSPAETARQMKQMLDA